MGGQRVVIVDGDAGWRCHVASLLTRAGYRVVEEAANGIEGLKAVRARQPDVVLSEVNLAGMSGFELARTVQEDRLAPVILMSGSYDLETLERVREVRVFGYLVKPFDEAVLLPAVEVALANFQEFLRLDRQVRELRETLETRKIVERAKGILMEKLGLTEAEAFRRIQKTSMDKRISMRAVAEAIILTYEI